MTLRLIPPGEFTRGSTPEGIEEVLQITGPNDAGLRERVRSAGPQHKVVLTRPVYYGVHEVTQGQYEAARGKNPSFFAKTGPRKDLVEKIEGSDTSRHPVEGVPWNDAAEFCAKLSAREKRKPFYFVNEGAVTPLEGGTGYRLPTEAESEFAGRAGTTTNHWTGDTEESLLDGAGWLAGISGERTHAVGELKSNPFGLFDTQGNVWEWCSDWADAQEYAQFAKRPAVDPQGPQTGMVRSVRGGSWVDRPLGCRSGGREWAGPLYFNHNLGFRVILPVEADSPARHP
jgi:formylglycine-generating enzyme required for sulfatase activity